MVKQSAAFSRLNERNMRARQLLQRTGLTGRLLGSLSLALLASWFLFLLSSSPLLSFSPLLSSPLLSSPLLFFSPSLLPSKFDFHSLLRISFSISKLLFSLHYSCVFIHLSQRVSRSSASATPRTHCISSLHQQHSAP